MILQIVEVLMNGCNFGDLLWELCGFVYLDSIVQACVVVERVPQKFIQAMPWTFGVYFWQTKNKKHCLYM
jgi:hypothetical protein